MSGVPDDDRTAPGVLRSGSSGSRPAAAEGNAQTTFCAGDLVAERYRVIRFLDQGGMGEVYEALDVDLNERVALKTVRPEIAQPSTITRFKREIRVARRVTHPNVCRIFDLGHHLARRADGSSTTVTFLTMELLEGESLSARLRREGRMTPAEALPVVGQMAAGLDAAHRAGVVHRDFKCSNVMLVPSGAGPPRAVVTDFGLAFRADDKQQQPNGELEGTPRYMAPEQVSGDEITAAADVYAFGIVLYEMLTGEAPFAEKTPTETALRRLELPAPSPLEKVPDLDPLWAATVMRCLERKPERRFAFAGEAAAALGYRDVGPARRRVPAWAIAAALCVAALGGYGAAVRGRHARVRPSVAVFGLANLSGRAESAWVSTAVAEMLATELAIGERVAAVPGENVARLQKDLHLPVQASFARETLERIRTNLDARFAVTGSYLAAGGGQLRVEVRLADAVSGETVATLVETGAEAQLFDLVARTGAGLRRALGAADLSTGQAGQLRASQPGSAEANRLYAEGVARLLDEDAVAARDLLERAVALEPDFALSHHKLSSVYYLLGYDAKAKAEARRAVELSRALPREEQLLIEINLRLRNAEAARAVELAQTLVQLFPDRLEHGLKLAQAQVAAGHGEPALATLARLRKLPPPAGDDPAIDYWEASAANQATDFERQLAAARRCVARARDRGAQLLRADCRSLEAAGEEKLGRLDEALEALRDARALYAAAGNRRGEAKQMTSIGNLLFDRGDPNAAMTLYQSALAIDRAIGNRLGIAWAQGGIGDVHKRRGHLRDAEAAYSEAMQLYGEIGRNDAVSIMRHNLAVCRVEQGRLTEAVALFEQTLAAEVAEKDDYGEAMTLSELSDLWRKRGQLARARTSIDRALMLFRKMKYRDFEAAELEQLAVVTAAQGDGRAALELLKQGVAILVEIGEKAKVANARTLEAQLRLDAGEPGCGPLSREGLAGVRMSALVDYEVEALDVQVRCQLSEGDRAGAAVGAREAATLAAGNESVRVTEEAALAGARVQMASGDRAGAIRTLERLRDEAVESGNLADAFELRLLIGGRHQLDALARDAQAAGFVAIARRARARQ
jgi:tetratricopeptide (TPR) repeat protein/TolB-like protein/tRNA A-37 threonylcarbamoyl transferase component Bud32